MTKRDSIVFINLCKEYLSADVKKIKVLSKTYMQTLELINENMTISDMAIKRELKELTIVAHISELNLNKYIDNDIKTKLFEPLLNNIPEEINKWILSGLQINDISDLKKNLALYSYLN